MTDAQTINRMTDLLRRRNEIELELLRAQAEIDAILAAAEIRVAQGFAMGNGRDAPAAPRGLPESVKTELSRSIQPVGG